MQRNPDCSRTLKLLPSCEQPGWSLSAVDRLSGGPSVPTFTRPDSSPRDEENVNVNDPRPSASNRIASTLHTPCLRRTSALLVALELGLRSTAFPRVSARVILTAVKMPRPVKPREASYSSCGHDLRREADAGRANYATLLHHSLHFT